MADPEFRRSFSSHLEDEVVAAVFVPERPEQFVGTVRLLAEDYKLPVVVGAPAHIRLEELAELAIGCHSCPSAAALVNDVGATARSHILVVTDAVLFPPEFLAPGLAIVTEDLRVATVSFFGNDAGFLSFPQRNSPVGRAPEGQDETTVTRRLRQLMPREAPVPLPAAAGPVVLLSAVALGVVGPLVDSPSGAFGAALTDFCYRGRERGFIDILDPSTFATRPSDISVEPRGGPPPSGLSPSDKAWLKQRHRTMHTFLEDEVLRTDSPLGIALGVARVKVEGVSVIVDGSCLGPHEMGTQVTTVALIEALAARGDVREVRVSLPGPVPAYARHLLGSGRVRLGLPDEMGEADIFHRPFQPNVDFDVGRWRRHAHRVVVSVLDLISFHIGSYSGDAGAWARYRESLRLALRSVDGVVTISHDVRRHLEFERMPVSPERVFVIPCGTEHLSGDESARVPAELAARGFAAGEFLLCLGTNYTHKNRDLAVRMTTELRRRGHDLALVMTGPVVPWGSSRALEARAAPRDGIFVLPEVSSEERNWLVRHAALVLYPTSAEGFGLVPYEAARFGTPTVHVGFGPLREVGGDLPVVAEDWRPESLADAAEALLGDPALARRQVASCLEVGASYTWARTSEMLTEAYRTILAWPSVASG
jgi:glycosyltransferase involved in cell wall biosynthesis